MDKEYWTKYYQKYPIPSSPSPFAVEVLKRLTTGQTLLELGCGNGRDSVYFGTHKIKTTGVDQVCGEIEYLNSAYKNGYLNFICDDFTNLQKINKKYNAIYSRFTLHAIKEKEEDNVINWVFNNLEKKGQFFLEVRSKKDDLAKEGDAVVGEKNAKITSHYRRFADFNQLKQKVEVTGFDLLDAVEGTGFAPYKDEDPIIIRIICQKP
ncbi:MAG: class I SAM-dependent methyltransferase [Prolixibacteraceae bacterium]|nr:class I SAM-dependent methyltransferase [Prolixibacteraceae bacterium]